MAGSATARKSRRGRQRSTSPVNYWHRPAPEVTLGRYQWRVTIQRGKATPLVADQTVKAVSWSEDANNVMTGSITMQNPKDEVKPVVGDLVRLQWSFWGQEHWRTAFLMTLAQPQYQVGEDQWVFQLEDALTRANRSELTLRFREDRAHPNGWRADDAIAHVLREVGIPAGRLPRMEYRARRLTFTKQPPQEIIATLLRHERRKSGKRYFLRWIEGRLSVVPYQRSKDMLIVGGYIMSGSLTESLKENFATVLHVTATSDEGDGNDAKGRRKHKKRKLRVTVQSERGIARYGRVVRSVSTSGADTLAEARAWGKRELARRGRPHRDLSFTHPGVPTLRRGDALRLTIADAGIDREIVFVSEVAHDVQPGAYNMDVTVAFDDPYVDKVAERARRKKQRAARKRGRAEPKRTSKPQPKKGRQRR